MARKSKSRMRRSKIRSGKKKPNKQRLKHRRSHLRRMKRKKSKNRFMSGGWGAGGGVGSIISSPTKRGYVQTGGSDPLSGGSWS